MGMFLYPFRNVTPYKLFLAGLVLILIGSTLDIKDYFTNKEINKKANIAQAIIDRGDDPEKEYKEALETWQAIEKEAKPSQEVIDERIESRHKGYFSVVKSLAPINASFQSKFAHRYDVWDILSIMLIGIWILQLILSPPWLKYFKMGPLEWFWRWLIYMQQPELAQHSPLKTENS